MKQPRHCFCRESVFEQRLFVGFSLLFFVGLPDSVLVSTELIFHWLVFPLKAFYILFVLVFCFALVVQPWIKCAAQNLTDFLYTDTNYNQTSRRCGSWCVSASVYISRLEIQCYATFWSGPSGWFQLSLWLKNLTNNCVIINGFIRPQSLTKCLVSCQSGDINIINVSSSWCIYIISIKTGNPFLFPWLCAVACTFFLALISCGSSSSSSILNRREASQRCSLLICLAAGREFVLQTSKIWRLVTLDTPNKPSSTINNRRHTYSKYIRYIWMFYIWSGLFMLCSCWTTVTCVTMLMSSFSGLTETHLIQLLYSGNTWQWFQHLTPLTPGCITVPVLPGLRSGFKG